MKFQSKCPRCDKELEVFTKEIKATPQRGELCASVADWPTDQISRFVKCSCGYWDIINDESDSTLSNKA